MEEEKKEEPNEPSKVDEALVLLNNLKTNDIQEEA